MRTGLWGRSRWLWGLELLVVLCFLVVFVETDRATVKLIVAGSVLIRLVVSAFQIAEWRRRQRRASDDARDDGVVSPD